MLCLCVLPLVLSSLLIPPPPSASAILCRRFHFIYHILSTRNLRPGSHSHFMQQFLVKYLLLTHAHPAPPSAFGVNGSFLRNIFNNGVIHHLTHYVCGCVCVYVTREVCCIYKLHVYLLPQLAGLFALKFEASQPLHEDFLKLKLWRLLDDFWCDVVAVVVTSTSAAASTHARTDGHTCLICATCCICCKST